MTTTTANHTPEASSTATPITAMTTRLKTQWETGRAQLARIPASLRSQWQQTGERLCRLLNLPTKDDLAALTARLDDMEARLSRKTPAVAEKRSRKPKKN